MNDCIFCKIVAGTIPCHKVYENDLLLGFLDINPKSIGHCLLIPKQHFRWVYDVPFFGQYFESSKIIIEKLLKSTNANSISIVTIGEDVPHAHIQLIPQYEVTSNLSNLSLQQIADKINS